VRALRGVVGHDNCVTFRTSSSRSAASHRCHFVRAKVRVRRYVDDTLAIPRPRCLARLQRTRANRLRNLNVPPRNVRSRRRADPGASGYALRPRIGARLNRTIYVLQNRTVLFATDSALQRLPIRE